MTANGGLQRIAVRALVSGSVANVVLTVGLAMTARAERKASLRPLNATSHWLNGDDAGATGEVDFARTGIGFATNHAACLFWAVPFEAWQALRPARCGASLMRDAVAMAAIAAAVDYGATPKRFTPGWEHVLSRSGMVSAYAALALGFMAGASLTSTQLR